jgi:Ku protein
MVDEETGKVVDKEHKGRGYELSKGRYVEIDEDELQAIEIESTHAVDIDSFVPLMEIDKRYLDKPYYITPDGKMAAEAFVVIRDAMKDKERVGCARREHIVALEAPRQGDAGHAAALRLRGARQKGRFRRGAQPARAEGNARTCRKRKLDISVQKDSRMILSWRCGSW